MTDNDLAFWLLIVPMALLLWVVALGLSAAILRNMWIVLFDK